MATLTAKEQLAKARATVSLGWHTIHIGALGIDVAFGHLGALQALELQDKFAALSTPEMARFLFKACICEPAYTEAEVDELLSLLPLDALMPLLNELLEFNNMKDKVELNGKEVTQLEAVAYSFPVEGAEPTGLQEAVPVSLGGEPAQDGRGTTDGGA